MPRRKLEQNTLYTNFTDEIEEGHYTDNSWITVAILVLIMIMACAFIWYVVSVLEAVTYLI